LKDTFDPDSPSLSLSAPTSAISLCVDVAIEITDVKGDGKQKLLAIEWRLTNIYPSNSIVMSKLSLLCNKANEL
jgi:hypothetical protein